jgi:hypothetical protein
MAELDHVLARIIGSRDASAITAVRQHLPAEFVNDLVDLFENRADDPNRWMALASGLGEASLLASSAAAFRHIPPLLSLAKERAKVYLEWARQQENLGQIQEAAIHYTTAARLDPACTEAQSKAAAPSSPLPPLVVGDWRVFGTLTDAPAFHRLAPLSLFPSIASDICRSALAKRYFLERKNQVLGTTMDCSFVVAKGSRPVLLVECDIFGDARLACHEVPIVLASVADGDEDEMVEATELALHHLVKIARHVDARTISLEEPDIPLLTPVSVFTATRVANFHRVERASVDLARDPAAIWADVRKGHRHTVNRGRTEFGIHPWEEGDDRPIETFFALYEGADRASAFHSGAEIRAFLEGGDGDLIVASIKGEPLAAVLVAYEGEAAYYMASISVNHSDVPASHWPLYRAILRARDKGKQRFDLGYLHVDEGMNEKLRGIARFKGGFTRDRRPYLWWNVLNDGAAE